MGEGVRIRFLSIAYRYNFRSRNVRTLTLEFFKSMDIKTTEKQSILKFQVGDKMEFYLRTVAVTASPPPAPHKKAGVQHSHGKQSTIMCKSNNLNADKMQQLFCLSHPFNYSSALKRWF